MIIDWDKVYNDVMDWDKIYNDIMNWKPGDNPVMATQLPPGSSGPKFKKGDKVQHTWGAAQSEEGIIGDAGSLSGDTYVYWVKFGNWATYCKEHELSPVKDGTTDFSWAEDKCQCGSTITYGETGFHSSWCPKNGS